MSFRDISLKVKLLAGFTALLLIFSASAFFNYTMLQAIKCAQDTQMRRMQDETIATQMKTCVGMLSTSQSDLIINHRADTITQYQKDAVLFRELIDKVIAQADTEEERSWGKELKATGEEYLKQFNRVVAVYEQRASLSPADMAEQYQRIDEDTDRARSRFMQLADEYIEAYADEANEAEKESKSFFAQAVTASFVGFGLAALLGIGLAISFAGRISAAVNVMLEGATAVAAGDLTRQLPVTSKDELGQLTEAFNRMTMSLQQIVRQVFDSAENLAATSQQLSATTQETAAFNADIAGTVSHMAKGAGKQAKAVDETHEVIRQVCENILLVDRNVETASQGGEKAAETAQAGSIQAGEAVRKIRKVQETTIQMGDVITALGEQSQEISQIVEAIKAIAAQTNLLALNAAIEAARAGEQGRGFAVVAEEVRKLAEQSAASAEQIAGLIDSVQGQTAQAIAAMNVNKGEVAAGAASVDAAGRAFDTIAADVNRVVAQIESVSGATRQITEGAEKAVQSVTAIAGVAREAAAGTEQMAARIQEQSAAMEEVAASAQMLAKLSEEMQGIVAGFKV
ncbi:HAMP domain-containing protein [Heliobacterium undosum]|uniref:HAMP domain-containing protein n=1 Tax=Heliomicrobium undosum TaxID=121734 RepID=A0A845L6E1_9FIRM|nr:methyl-accepting chemotaxis protein [Heliomicrobium undosum]MZP30605.1 HAMP domain-containing protein [Heliomicrobium undosum]